MRNAAFRKFIVYAMIGIMLLSSFMFGLSFIL
ncbi:MULTISPECIES: stressosome-associated protein Prli42 [Planococcus]|nr:MULTISPECIES: stressosome-associated protein Prli42 [Planococcus]MDJ0332333.1 stressosome-associated protein Prli42 [Planococcus sp. S3-L1]